MKKYYPYPSDRKAKKFYIITDDNKKIYFETLDMSILLKDI